MVDALNFFESFATSDFLSDRQAAGTVDEQDERNVRVLGSLVLLPSAQRCASAFR